MSLLSTIAALPAHVVSAAGNLLGAGVSTLGQSLLNRQGLAQSKEMYDYQLDYKKRMDAMIAAGISPAAASQGLSGAHPSAVGMSGGSAPDLSSLGTQMVGSSLVPSQIEKNSADANYTNIDASWIPHRYQSMIEEAFSRVRKNDSDITFNSHMRRYYDALERQTRLLTPYQVQKASEEIRNLQAQYDAIRAGVRFTDAQTSKVDQEKFKLQWDNSIRKVGWNPEDNAFENVFRLSFTSPKYFKRVLGSFGKSLSVLDMDLQHLFGTNYKRNSLIGAGLLYGGKTYFDMVNSNLRVLAGLLPKTIK